MKYIFFSLLLVSSLCVVASEHKELVECSSRNIDGWDEIDDVTLGLDVDFGSKVYSDDDWEDIDEKSIKPLKLESLDLKKPNQGFFLRVWKAILSQSSDELFLAVEVPLNISNSFKKTSPEASAEKAVVTLESSVSAPVKASVLQANQAMVQQPMRADSASVDQAITAAVASAILRNQCIDTPIIPKPKL